MKRGGIGSLVAIENALLSMHNAASMLRDAARCLHDAGEHEDASAVAEKVRDLLYIYEGVRMKGAKINADLLGGSGGLG